MSINELITRADHAVKLSDPSGLRRVVEEAESIVSDFEDISRTTLEAHIAHWKGVFNYFTSNYEMAHESLRHSLELFTAVGNPKYIAQVTVTIGSVFKDTGDLPQALDHFKRALEISEAIDNREYIARSTGSIGGIHYSMGDYPAAFECYLKALDFYEEVGDKPKIARYYGNIGLLYSYSREFETAIYWLNKSLTMFRELNDKKGIAHISGLIGHATSCLGRVVEAEQWYRTSLELTHELGMRREYVFFASGLLDVLLTKNLLVEATAIAEKYYKQSEEFHDAQCGFLISMSHLEKAKGNSARSKEHLQLASSIAKEYSLKEPLAMAHKGMRDLCRESGPLNDYVIHNEHYEALVEEIRGEQVAHRLAMANVELKISQERKEAEAHRTLLHNVMPAHIATRILAGEKLIADEINDVAVFFLDIVEFTELASRIPPAHLVFVLNAVFNKCDQTVRQFGMTKIKTIGDAFLAVAGVPAPLSHDMDARTGNASLAALYALELQQQLDTLYITLPDEMGDKSWTKSISGLKLRMGMHIGPIVAGVVGTDRVAFDVWGDAVNVASRMEQTCEPGMIQVSDAFAKSLPEVGRPETDGDDSIIMKWQQGKLRLRGTIKVKGKGEVKTWWLQR